MAKRLGERVDRSCRIRVSLHEVFPDFIRCYFKSRLGNKKSLKMFAR